MTIRPILLVDDDARDRELALDALVRAGLANEVVVACDGAEALDYLFRRGASASRPAGDPCVVLLDLKMPKVDGLEVLATLKGNRATRRIPVVMFTGSREDLDIVESYRLGINAYVVKPLDPDDFLKALRDVGAFWGTHNVQPEGGLG